MTELMKRYLKETGESIQIRGTLMGRNYVAWLETKVLDEKTIEKFQEIIRNQCDEISALKDQLRWRPVSEKPEKEQYFLANPSQADRDLIINACPRTYQFLGECSWEKFVQSRGIVRWFPVPPAPEGE